MFLYLPGYLLDFNFPFCQLLPIGNSVKNFVFYFPTGGRPRGSSSSSKRSGSRSSERPVDPAPRSKEGMWMVGSASSTSGGVCQHTGGDVAACRIPGGVSQPSLRAVAACQQGQLIIGDIVNISILSVPLVLLP